MKEMEKVRSKMAGRSKREVVAVCHNIRSAYNIGSIFRTADGAGVVKVYLSGYSPAPPHPGISKAALGAEKMLAWKKVSRLDLLLKRLKFENFQVVALEQDKKSVPIKSYKPGRKIALIVGNEVRGLDKKILNKCDAIIEIPMRGEKESLNVSVAFGIAVYSMTNCI